MCTDLRLIRLSDLHVSARTLDFAFETQSQVEIVPRGQQWQSAVADGALSWSNHLGFVALNGLGFPDYFADGLNEAGLSVGTLWLPETQLPAAAPAGEGPAIDFLSLAGWLLGTCASVEEVKAALPGVRVWNPPLRDLWPAARPLPKGLQGLADWAIPEHLAIHDAHGHDLVVEFLDGQMLMHDNPAGVLTNSPTFDWHLTNLRNYVGLTNVEAQPYTLSGNAVTPTGNGTGLLGMPGDVTPPSRFVRATVMAQTVTAAADARAAINQAFHCLNLVSVPRHLAASGDYTQWSVARDHDNAVLYVRAYDSWATGAHDLAALEVTVEGLRRTHPMPAVTTPNG